MNNGRIHIILSVCALSISVAALVITSRHTIDVSFTIGGLSALVTILIGWNIYSLFDIKEAKKEIDNQSTLMIGEYERAMFQLYSALAMFYMSISSRDNQSMIITNTQFVLYSVYAISHASLFEDYDTCAAQVKVTMEAISDQNINITRKGKKNILEALSLVKNGYKINGYGELLERIGRLGVE